MFVLPSLRFRPCSALLCLALHNAPHFPTPSERRGGPSVPHRNQASGLGLATFRDRSGRDVPLLQEDWVHRQTPPFFGSLQLVARASWHPPPLFYHCLSQGLNASQYTFPHPSAISASTSDAVPELTLQAMQVPPLGDHAISIWGITVPMDEIE